MSAQRGETAPGSEAGVGPLDVAAVLRRALPARRRAAPGIVLGVLADACIVGLLGLSMWLIVRAGEQPPILYLTFAIVGVRAFAVGRAALRYGERIASHDAVLQQLSQLRTETFSALVPRVPGAIETHRRGEVLSAFVDDVDQLQDYPLRVRQPLIVSGVIVTASVATLALIAPVAALSLAALLLLAGGTAAWLSARISGDSDAELSEARAALADALLERSAAAEVLTAFDALGVQRERISAAEQRLTRIQLSRARASGLTGATLSLAAGVASIVILLALHPAVGETLSGALFAAAVVIPAAVFEVFAQIPAALVARRTVLASAARVAALTDTPLAAELPIDPVDPQDLPCLRADGSARGGRKAPGEAQPILQVRDLEVRHPGAVRPAVRGVSFTLRQGETLLVTGQSGAGKTTLALALVRLLEYRGSYRLCGVEAHRLRGSDVRAVVGLCEQLPHLFDADLRQNLLFARDTASDDELIEVLERVGLAGWARERGGLDAQLGERGALVSGGQAQRIALARAILADFPVVILDEPTAGVDRDLADRLLIDLIGAVPDERAVIVITHTELPAQIQATRLELNEEPRPRGAVT